MAQKEYPHLTVNKLGEFITANPKRQRRILEQLKYPKDNAFGFSHKEAREAVKLFFIKEFEEGIITDCIEALERKVTDSEHAQNQINASIEGLEAVLDGNSDFNSNFVFEFYEGDNPKLIIEGVEVSVYPDLIIRSISRKVKYVGAMKLHMSKSFPVPEEGGKYIAAVLYRFVEKHVKKRGENVKTSHCLSYDIHTDSLVECPAAVKRRWDDIEAACMNIAAIWDSI